MNNSMYYKSIYYAFIMVLCGVFSYLFLNSGLNTTTKRYVYYENNSDVIYKVNYIEDNYSNNTNKYISNLVNDIDISFNYENILSEYVSGYYKYDVVGYLTTYMEDINDELWIREKNIIDDKVIVLDENNINSININDSFKIDFKEYRKEIYDFINEYDMELSGYLSIKINIMEYLNFSSLDNEYDDYKTITINIPLTNDTFKINIDKINNIDNYYEFKTNTSMNIILLVIGVFCLSLTITSIIMVIRQFKIIYKNQSIYKKELKYILSKYDEFIVKVNKMIVTKKYNMIYVDNFEELLDVHNKKNLMISFKEVKRDSESIFVIIDEFDAWIYRLSKDDIE